MIINVREHNPSSEIYIQSILPISKEREVDYASNFAIREFNEGIKRVSDVEQVGFIDLYNLYVKDGYLDDSVTEDGVHIRMDVYDRWANTVKPYIMDCPNVFEE